MTLVFLATLGAATVAFVLYPVFFEESKALESPDAEGLELRDLEEKKTRLYEAVKDLDFEKEAGKVSDADYENARNDYLTQVAEVLKRIDTLAPPKPMAEERKTRPQKKAGTRRTGRACASCGGSSPASAKFCKECGKAFESVCASCGADLPEGAKFCTSCGEKVSA